MLDRLRFAWYFRRLLRSQSLGALHGTSCYISSAISDPFTLQDHQLSLLALLISEKIIRSAYEIFWYLKRSSVQLTSTSVSDNSFQLINPFDLLRIIISANWSMDFWKDHQISWLCRFVDLGKDNQSTFRSLKDHINLRVLDLLISEKIIWSIYWILLI